MTVRLDMKKDCFFAEFSNLGVGNVPIADEYPEKFDRLLCGGIWCIVQLDYEVEGDNNFGIEDIDGNPLRSKQKKQKDISPISIRKLTPIQMPHIDIDELKQGRKAFSKDEWLDILLRSIGMEPDEFTYREKWLLLTRMIPLVENNFNLCELGPRSTGKSHLYKEISPNSILISGGQTTVANLFYNMGRKTVGLVGLWDCVAFDEVAGIKFKDKDGIQIMKDYMASGSFARGKEEKAATASMVFVGNINQSVDVLLKRPVCLHLSRRKWEQIQHFLIVCIVIFQDGRYRSSDRSILPMITVLSVTIWQSSSESFARSSMEMHLITTSAWGEI